MTRDEGVAIIKQQLGFRTTLDTEIVTQMKLAQTTLERSSTKPWFLESDPTATLTTVAGTATIALPAGFICEMEEERIILTDNASPPQQHILFKDEFTVLKRQFLNADNGLPEAYALLKNNIYLFPTPDAVYSMSWRYYKADAVLDTNIENAWLREVPLLLLGSAGELIAGPIRDADAMKMFAQWIQTGLAIVNKHDSQREVAGRDLQMGGAHN